MEDKHLLNYDTIFNYFEDYFLLLSDGDVKIVYLMLILSLEMCVNKLF